MSSICLKIHGLSHVPSFKNGKMLTRGRLITDPKKKRWMESAISQFECQLRGLFPMRDGETAGEWQKRLQTVWWQLLDDSSKHMWPGNQCVVQVNKGEEGAVVTIERLP